MKAMHASDSDEQKKKPKLEKKKRRRKPRKDIGTQKTSMAEQLSGFVEVERSGEDIHGSQTDAASSTCEEPVVPLTSEEELVPEVPNVLFPIRKRIYESDIDDEPPNEVKSVCLNGESSQEKSVEHKTFDFSTFLL